MRKWTLPLAAAGLAALSIGTLHAQQGGAPQLPGQLDASRLEARAYKIDKNHTQVGWRVVASQGLHDHLLRAGQDGKKPDFFGPSQAAAHFVSTNVAVNGNKATITGDFTLNGVTKPVTIQAEFTGAGNSFGPTPKKTVGFEGTATIKRSDWGLSTFVPMVSDEVELTITTAFEKQ